MSKPKFPPAIKIHACEDFLHEKYTSAQVCEKYGITYNKKNYSSKLKTQAVEEYLSGKGTILETTVEYGVSATKVFRRWILKYKANMELKSYDPKKEVYMAKARRTTTLEKRKEIAEYCIAHDRNYKDTASLYGVSYNQVHSWVKKYDTAGKYGVSDKRRHHKRMIRLTNWNVFAGRTCG